MLLLMKVYLRRQFETVYQLKRVLLIECNKLNTFINNSSLISCREENIYIFIHHNYDSTKEKQTNKCWNVKRLENENIAQMTEK